eukprot:6423110-Amphidinium_carterae.1
MQTRKSRSHDRIVEQWMEEFPPEKKLEEEQLCLTPVTTTFRDFWTRSDSEEGWTWPAYVCHFGEPMQRKIAASRIPACMAERRPLAQL